MDRMTVKRDDNGETAGVLRKYRDGWRFFPANAAHKPSRKAHEDWCYAVPKWVGGYTVQ